MISVKKFSFSGGNTHADFEIFSHAGFYFLHLDNKRIAKADNKKTLDAYIDGWMKGLETGYSNGYEARKAFEEKKKAKETNQLEQVKEAQ